MTAISLLQQANNAFDNNDNALGLKMLREYISDNATDIEELYRLAVIEEQIGTKDNALKAYFRCIKHDRNFVRAYLYAGYLLQQTGQLEKALAFYSLGYDQDARLINLHQNKNLSYETRLRSYTANIELRKYLTNLHWQSVENSNKSIKIAKAVWPKTHLEKVKYLESRQRPHLFYIPNLSAQPIYDNNNFEWCMVVENAFEELTSEFSELFSLIDTMGEPYLDNSFKSRGFELLAGSMNWSALSLFKDGMKNDRLAGLMPKTLAMLNKLPLYRIDENPFEVFFSLLKAGQHITPHFGQSNHSLTVHLPIVVPKGGYLTVANQKRYWQKGKPIVFDDSFEHEAINPSNEDRIVLIFSIWHPDLSIEEQQDILASFKARKLWLESRNQYIDWESSA